LALLFCFNHRDKTTIRSDSVFFFWHVREYPCISSERNNCDHFIFLIIQEWKMNSCTNDLKSDETALTLHESWAEPYAIHVAWPGADEFKRYQFHGAPGWPFKTSARETTITGLQPDTTYRFYIAGMRHNDQWSENGPTLTIKTRSTTFPIWETEVTKTSFKLNWDADGKRVLVDVDGIQTTQSLPAYKVIQSLEPGQMVKCKLRLETESEWNDFTFTIPRDLPTPPTFLEAYDQSSDRVSLYWNSGGVDGGTPRYRIERDGKLLGIKDRPPYIDTTPQQGCSHVYSVQTMDDQSNLSEKITHTVDFDDFTAPTDPTNLSTSHLTLTLKWDESYDSAGQVFYDVDQDGDYLGTTKEVEFAITGLDSGQRYTFGVTAKDPSDNKSNRATVTYPAIGVPLKHQR
jgi:chitin-binding protein